MVALSGKLKEDPLACEALVTKGNQTLLQSFTTAVEVIDENVTRME